MQHQMVRSVIQVNKVEIYVFEKIKLLKTDIFAYFEQSPVDRMFG